MLLALLALAAGASNAETFPGDKLGGVWKMSQTYAVERSTSGTGLDVEIEERIAVTLAFFGDGTCRMTASRTTAGSMTAVMPFRYKYSYQDGVLAFTDIVGGRRGSTPMDQMVPCLNATCFKLIKKGDDSFVMKYADLASFDKFYSFLGTQTSEYLGDGRLKVRRTSKLTGEIMSTATEIRPPMVFRRVVGMSSDAFAGEDSPIYRVISCQREGEKDFAYRFKLELVDRDSNKLDMYRMVQREFRTAVLEDSAQRYEGDASALFVEFTEFRLSDCTIEGLAVVLSMDVQSVVYDSATRKGRMAVSLKANQLDVARRYVRKNIEALAIDSNIATTGERPPPGRFYLGREELKDGNVLEIEFRTE